MKFSVSAIVIIIVLIILFFGLIHFIGQSMKAAKTDNEIETAEPIPTHLDNISDHLGMTSSTDKAEEIEKKKKKLMAEREDRLRTQF